MRTICILDNLLLLSDEELLTVLPYIRINGEKPSLLELKHYLKEEKRRKNHEQMHHNREFMRRS